MAKKTFNFGAWLSKYLLDVLEKEFVKSVLKKVFNKTVGLGGFRVWLVKFVAKEFWDELARPIILYGIRKGLLVYDLTTGKIVVAKIKKAYDENDQDGYDRNIDDLFD